MMKIIKKRPEIILYIVFIVVLNISCKKDSANGQPNGSSSTVLTGTWELRVDSFPQLSVPRDYAPGNGNQLIFSVTTYKSFYFGYGVESGKQHTDSGTYYIKDLPNSNPQLVFNEDSLPPRDLFLINKDTLTLFVGELGADGDIQIYVKTD